MQNAYIIVHFNIVLYNTNQKGVIKLPIKFHLSKLIGEQKLKMSDIAKLSDVHRNTIMSLYHEDAKGITWEVLAKLCAALNCQPGDLLEYVPTSDKMEQ
jgi:putative transcriptional regulator